MTLQEFFAENARAAIAFSGGVDSSYLLYAAVQCGADVHAYFAKTAFQPQFELDDARRLAESVGAKLTVLELDALSSEDVARNPANRCYYCKQNIFGNLKRAAAEDGFTLILDGTRIYKYHETKPTEMYFTNLVSEFSCNYGFFAD